LSGLTGQSRTYRKDWIPAFARMTIYFGIVVYKEILNSTLIKDALLKKVSN
jgi:hypothetical protein